jgi:2-polyprenyl-6-methoxyphenol hydroxylase-like FAD-dependent oxidoreductase
MRVLISGAGIAGATLACLLVRDGHQVMVVERDQGTRSSGNPVDVRGSAFDSGHEKLPIDGHEAARWRT